MARNPPADDHAPVLVEFELGPGLRQVSLSPEEVAQKSVRALDAAMHAVQHVAARVGQMIVASADRPSHVEMSFGLKFDVEAGAIVAKVSSECAISVKLVWDAGRGR